MKTMYRLVVIMFTAVALLMLSAPVYASQMDDRIESSAKKSYVFKNYLQGDDIKVQSKDGAVTLTGTVSEEYQKSLAQETVANLPDVKSVDNRLKVKGAPPAKNSDAWITTKVKAILLFHRNVSAVTEVNTTNGIVTLRGHASSEAEKDLTTEYAKDVEGVKDVKNDMIVGKASKKKQSVGGQIDDASITAQVKMTLLYHRSTSALNTSVATKRGVVTLSGKAKNAAEKDLAAKYANDVKGVKSVNNQMTIG
ncbi:MAG: transport-associated protein [Deltaproteobacteria bacterium RBG_19FT_COMBO_43_11]|nr:MAG: transport-associated protein [Deltaproteobacteria bacterium RBG_16_44_11]OGP88064.1 MAG: transport-associated protein [Deltaproteobacteria bacterium RBG_19FT_COMBO_43_11]